MSGFGRGKFGVGSTKNTGGYISKWNVTKNPLDLEKDLKHLTASDSAYKKKLARLLDDLEESAKSDLDKQAALALIKMQFDIDTELGGMDKDTVDNFNRFLTGRLSEEDAKKEGVNLPIWSKGWDKPQANLMVIPGVKEYINALADERFKMEKAILQLRKFGPIQISGTDRRPDLNSLWLYWKYGMRDDNISTENFLDDWKIFHDIKFDERSKTLISKSTNEAGELEDPLLADDVANRYASGQFGIRDGGTYNTRPLNAPGGANAKMVSGDYTPPKKPQQVIKVEQPPLTKDISQADLTANLFGRITGKSKSTPVKQQPATRTSNNNTPAKKNVQTPPKQTPQQKLVPTKATSSANKHQKLKNNKNSTAKPPSSSKKKAPVTPTPSSSKTKKEGGFFSSVKSTAKSLFTSPKQEATPKTEKAETPSSTPAKKSPVITKRKNKGQTGASGKKEATPKTPPTAKQKEATPQTKRAKDRPNERQQQVIKNNEQKAKDEAASKVRIEAQEAEKRKARAEAKAAKEKDVSTEAAERENPKKMNKTQRKNKSGKSGKDKAATDNATPVVASIPAPPNLKSPKPKKSIRLKTSSMKPIVDDNPDLRLNIGTSNKSRPDTPEQSSGKMINNPYNKNKKDTVATASQPVTRSRKAKEFKAPKPNVSKPKKGSVTSTESSASGNGDLSESTLEVLIKDVDDRAEAAEKKKKSKNRFKKAKDAIKNTSGNISDSIKRASSSASEGAKKIGRGAKKVFRRKKPNPEAQSLVESGNESSTSFSSFAGVVTRAKSSIANRRKTNATKKEIKTLKKEIKEMTKSLNSRKMQKFHRLNDRKELQREVNDKRIKLDELETSIKRKGKEPVSDQGSGSDTDIMGDQNQIPSADTDSGGSDTDIMGEQNQIPDHNPDASDDELVAQQNEPDSSDDDKPNEFKVTKEEKKKLQESIKNITATAQQEHKIVAADRKLIRRASLVSRDGHDKLSKFKVDDSDRLKELEKQIEDSKAELQKKKDNGTIKLIDVKEAIEEVTNITEEIKSRERIKKMEEEANRAQKAADILKRNDSKKKVTASPPPNFTRTPSGRTYDPPLEGKSPNPPPKIKKDKGKEKILEEEPEPEEEEESALDTFIGFGYDLLSLVSGSETEKTPVKKKKKKGGAGSDRLAKENNGRKKATPKTPLKKSEAKFAKASTSNTKRQKSTDASLPITSYHNKAKQLMKIANGGDVNSSQLRVISGQLAKIAEKASKEGDKQGAAVIAQNSLDVSKQYRMTEKLEIEQAEIEMRHEQIDKDLKRYLDNAKEDKREVTVYDIDHTFIPAVAKTDHEKEYIKSRFMEIARPIKKKK